MKQMSETDYTKIRNHDRQAAEMKRSLMLRGMMLVGGVPVHRAAPAGRKLV